jgi:hypothetical protein
MWCPNCKADVAAEVTADNRRVRCATCGADITAPTASAFAKTREARDLLERWASQRKTEPSVPRPTGTAARDAEQMPSGGGVSLEAERRVVKTPATKAEIETSRGKTAVRLDTPHPLPAPVQGTSGVQGSGAWRSGVSHSGRATAGAHRSAAVRQESPRRHRNHDRGLGAPHFQVQDNLFENSRKKINWSAIVGQLIAYAGVALLTVGSSLILWSYFGGPASYGPMGWLTTTAGQMLLFLGVITLVSGGMEQATEEVKTRIERLGERIIRIEQFSRDHALRGPVAPESFGSGGTLTDEPATRANDAA